MSDTSSPALVPIAPVLQKKAVTIMGPPEFQQHTVAHYVALFNYIPSPKCIKISANSGEPSFFMPDGVVWSAKGYTMAFQISSGNPVPHKLYVSDCLAGVVSDPFAYNVTP